MVIVERIFLEPELPHRALDFSRDTITLGWEDRTHVHGRRRTEGGVEFGTALPRGTVLHAGDCFVLDDERRVVMVVERPEAVSRCRTAAPAAQNALHASDDAVHTRRDRGRSPALTADLRT
jgi:urease accessory protein UreE